MPKTQSLADLLGVGDEKPKDPAAQEAEEQSAAVESLRLIEGDFTSAADFAERVLRSRDFRHYIVSGIRLGTLPSSVVLRLMDTGWGKPPEKVEHTGKDGRPIEMVTEVRRTIVRAPRSEADLSAPERPATPQESVH